VIVSLTDYIPEPRYDSLPWTHARLEEASSAGGPWTAIETFTLSPVDADPTQPVSRSFTTTLATLGAGWYRIVWVDDALQESATPGVQNVLPFATAADLAARLGLTFTTAEEDRADTLLTLATALIQSETQQTISLVTDDVLARPSEAGNRVRLPQRPVVSVASVTLTPQTGTPTTLDSNTYYLDGDELVRASFPIQYQQFFADWTRGWLGPLYTLTVTYTHGWAVIPAVVKGACLEMVARCFVNPGAVIQSSIAGVTDVYAPYSAPPSGLLMTDAEKKAVNDVVRRTSGSVTLR